MSERTEIDQTWFKYRKTLVAQIRLKHALHAVDEINARLHKAKKEFDKATQMGVLPAAPDILAALDEA